jgi:hypothetical protein
MRHVVMAPHLDPQLNQPSQLEVGGSPRYMYVRSLRRTSVDRRTTRAGAAELGQYCFTVGCSKRNLKNKMVHVVDIENDCDT